MCALVFQVRELLIVARVVCVGHKPLRFRRGGRVQAEQSAREGNGVEQGRAHCCVKSVFVCYTHSVFYLWLL